MYIHKRTLGKYIIVIGYIYYNRAELLDNNLIPKYMPESETICIDDLVQRKKNFFSNNKFFRRRIKNGSSGNEYYYYDEQ